MIAYLTGCQELSDQARRQVSTYGDEHRRAGELVEDALRLVRHADEVLRLAIAAERAASTSWQEIGERLDVSRQAAHERFARIVDEISDAVLFPKREPDHEGGLGWWACPDGLEDSEATVRRLDEWALRHREPADPGSGEHPISDGLGRREDLARVEATFSAIAPLPPAPYRAAFYRAQTLVPLRRGGSPRDRTYTLPQPAGLPPS